MIIKFKKATRKEIDDLLLNKLPDVLSEDQKKKKIENLLQELARNDLINNNRDGKESIWVKVPPKK